MKIPIRSANLMLRGLFMFMHLSSEKLIVMEFLRNLSNVEVNVDIKAKRALGSEINREIYCENFSGKNGKLFPVPAVIKFKKR